MSSSFVCLIFITAMIGYSTQQSVVAQPTCSVTESNANYPVLKWLKSQNVTILEMPDKNVDKAICGGNWAEKGTCCQVESIKEFIKKSNDRVTSKWGRYVSRISRIKGKLMQAFKKIIKAIKINSIKSKVNLMKVDKRMDSSFSKVFSMLPTTDEQLQSLKATIEGFEDKLAEFKKKGKECFDSMKSFRANMMCAACSATAAQYSSGQSLVEAKFKVDYSTCSALVTKCFSVWKFNFDLATMTQFFSALRTKGKSAKSFSSKYKSEKEVSSIDLENLKDDFAHCKLSADKDAKIVCDAEKLKISTVEVVTARFCNKLMSATQENSYVEGDESVDADIDDKDVNEADKTADETAKEDANSGTVVSRLLQSATNTEMNIGVEITNTGAYQNLLDSNSGLTPSASVDLSTAGDNTKPAYAGIFAVASVLIVLTASI